MLVAVVAVRPPFPRVGPCPGDGNGFTVVSPIVPRIERLCVRPLLLFDDGMKAVASDA
jgi:hypothetical protein